MYEASFVAVPMVFSSAPWDLRLDCTDCRKLKSLQSNVQLYTSRDLEVRLVHFNTIH